MTEPARIWFVTGASSGIGRELVDQALRAGEAVIAVSRHASVMPSAEHLLTIDADVRDQDAVHDAVSRAVERFGRLDVVVNNAGYGVWGAVEEVSDDHARAIVDTNVFGVLNVLRATLPVLRRQRSGHILQTSSKLGQMTYPGAGLLAATKFAVEGLSESLATEVGPLGIKVTVLEPGTTGTPFIGNADEAPRTLADYGPTAHAFLDAVATLPREAFAPVERLVTAIRAVVESENPPLRIAFGADSAEEIRAALVARLDELDAWADLTKSV